MQKILLTLCLLTDGDNILLGFKKTGLGKGRWNGFGGKVNEGESVEQAMRREVLEESGLQIKRADHRGVLTFENQGVEKILEVHVFHSRDYFGVPIETAEMRPQWFNISKIPFEKMWPDDRFWMPLLLAGKKFRGDFKFSEDKVISNYNLKEVENL